MGETKAAVPTGPAKTEANPNSATNRSGSTDLPNVSRTHPDAPRSSVKILEPDSKAPTGRRSEEDSGARPPSETDGGLKRAERASAGKETPSKTYPGKEEDHASKPGQPDSSPYSDKSSPAKEPFAKHDHAAYVELVRDRAIEVIKNDEKWSLARICRNCITDEWSLEVFFQQQKSFSFVTYIWDEVDQKWCKSFASDKRPLSDWDHHLRFSSASKECKEMKRDKQ